MYVDELNGYSQLSISTAIMNSLMSRKTSKLLFQHHICKYYHLVDMVVSKCPDLRLLLDTVKGISSHWHKNIYGSIIGMMMRRYMVYIDNPQWYGNYADTIFATNYCQVKAYLQRIVKVLNSKYKAKLGYLTLKLSRKDLLILSNRWTQNILPLCIKLQPKYKNLKDK
jgi:hypothetical protein